MPSDRKAKRASSAKAKSAIKPKAAPEDGLPAEEVEEGLEDELVEDVEGLSLSRQGSKRASRQKSTSAGKAGGSGGGAAAPSSKPSTPSQDSGRSCTGVLASHPQSRDIHISSLTLLNFGSMLLEDANLELNFGRYGTMTI